MSWVMASCEQQRVPQSSQINQQGPIPFCLNIPQNNPSSQSFSQVAQDNPFQVVYHNGHQYQLTQGIANQLRELPPLAPLRQRTVPVPVPTVSHKCDKFEDGIFQCNFYRLEFLILSIILLYSNLR